MIILDFEASGFTGYPVEVGWCSTDLLRGGSMLIQRCQGWDDYDWSASAQGIHAFPDADAECRNPPT